MAARVQHKADAAAVGRGRERGHHLFGARHLGHVLRMDEGDRLDSPGSRGLQTGDEVDAFDGFEDSRFVLQAIARADLDDLDGAAHGWPPGVAPGHSGR